jgi:hypothetical protein
MLTVGLLVGAGSGAIAAADSDDSGSTSNDAGSSGESTARAAAVNHSGTDHRGKRRLLASVLDYSAHSWSNHDSTLAHTNTGDEPDKIGTGRAEPLGSDPELVASDSNVPDSTPPANDELAGVGADAGATSANFPTAEAFAPASVIPVAQTVTPPVAPIPPAVKALEPVGNAVFTIANVMQSVPGTFAALKTSPMPVNDAIMWMQQMLTTVAGAVIPLAEVPGDLYAIFAVSALAKQPLIGATGLEYLANVASPTGTLFGSVMRQASYIAPTSVGASLFGTMSPNSGLGTVAATGLNQTPAVSGTVPPTLEPPTLEPPTHARSIFQHVLGAVLVPASLTALAAIALPGIGGLLVVAAAGVRFGYRQAKAALALRASGIARFAGPGPLGVVRSGSLVALRQRARGPRTVRAVCPEASRSLRAFESVA